MLRRVAAGAGAARFQRLRTRPQGDRHSSGFGDQRSRVAGITALASPLLLGWAEADHQAHAAALSEWLSSLLAAPLGPWLVALAGCAVAMMGVVKVVKAWRVDLEEHLQCGARMRQWAVPISRVGLTARGLLIVLVGASVILAGLYVQAERATGLAGVLRALERPPFGWLLLATAAPGLASFGVFGLIEAMYRRVDAPNLD